MEKSLKIAYIEPVGESGGMYHYNLGLLNNIEDSDIKISLYSTIKNRSNYRPNISIYNYFKSVWENKNRFIKGASFLFMLLGSVLHSRYKNNKLIHLHLFKIDLVDLFILFIARIIGLKVIATLHDIVPFKGSNQEKVERAYLKNLHAIIVHNLYSEQILKTKTSNNRIHIIPHGNYLPFLNKVDLGSSRIYRFDPDKFNMLFFGQIKDSKGLDILLEALQQVVEEKPEVKLHVYGKVWKSDTSKYEKLISDLGIEKNIETRFSYVEDKDLPYLFKQSHIVILPYKSIFQSGVLLFSMSYKKATLVSDLPPFIEIIKDGENGFVFKKNDSNSLAKKIIQVINNRNLLNDIGNNAYMTIKQKFDWADIGQTTKEVYKEVLNVNS